MDGGKRSYDKPPRDRAEGPPKTQQSESDLVPPPQFVPVQAPRPASAESPAAPSKEAEHARDDEPQRDESRLESGPVPPQFIPAQAQPPTPAESLAPELVTLPVPLEVSQTEAPARAASPASEVITLPIPLEAKQVPALAPDPRDAATEGPAAIAASVSRPDEFSRQYTDDERKPEPEAMSHPLKVAYGVVLGVLALSALGVLYVHLHHSDGARPTRAAAPITTSTSQPAKTPSTVVLPSTLSPSAEVAADDLVTSWSMNNRLGALAVATPTAATTLFSATYASGMAISRGCSTSFSPIVCTFGPPGGASPTDPIFQIRVSQVAGGWYVSSVRIEN